MPVPLHEFYAGDFPPTTNSATPIVLNMAALCGAAEVYIRDQCHLPAQMASKTSSSLSSYTALSSTHSKSSNGSGLSWVNPGSSLSRVDDLSSFGCAGHAGRGSVNQRKLVSTYLECGKRVGKMAGIEEYVA
ncbi:hypothetical protein HOY82DRAFT_601957 [Tuber indicum]|nr:hypothetical protein HOY82DRAFT_601957 [Tuber indicum]